VKTDKKDLAAMLVYIADWAVEHRLGTGRIYDNPPDKDACDSSIFINGNFARALTCAYEITGEKSYLEEAAAWCDYFVGYANSVKTSKGSDAVWWWDVEGNSLYLADTGTAVHALFKIFPHIDAQRRERYLDAFRKFYLLVSEGTEKDPMDRGQGPSSGWIVKEGDDAGALGDGYTYGFLELKTYTVSTATVGAQAFAALYKLTENEEYRDTALDAAMWLLRQVDESGTIPYRVAGTVENENRLQAIHYSLEGLLSSWLYLDDKNYNDTLMRMAPKILEFILREQNDSGYWGTERGYDGQRSAFLAHFLHWYYENVKNDTRAEDGADKFSAYVLDPVNTARYGIPGLIRVGGFVGLVFSSFLYPELDLRHPAPPVPICSYSIKELRKIAGKWKG
jgi:hypothetical protein